jgi:NDP-sugar pyrophosphorylase family protein
MIGAVKTSNNMYKILITTSGTGSRLNDLTTDKNKSLVKIANQHVIDWILNTYDPTIEIVITLGYFGEKTKEYIKSTYPDRNITFITVDPFEGPGSSLGYSMLQACEFLQCPFIFHCNDTIVIDAIPTLEKYNWIGISKQPDSTLYNSQLYSTVLTESSKLRSIQMKGAQTYDAFHIGLVGIYDYEKFWKSLKTEYLKNPYNASLSDVSAISEMIKNGVQFNTIEFKNWFDTGNLLTLAHAEKKLLNI